MCERPPPTPNATDDESGLQDAEAVGLQANVDRLCGWIADEPPVKDIQRCVTEGANVNGLPVGRASLPSSTPCGRTVRRWSMR